jgi:hypothetical protein
MALSHHHMHNVPYESKPDKDENGTQLFR